MRAEDNIQAAIISYLERALPADSYFSAIPNGAVLAGDKLARGKQMNRMKATGLRPGAPDLFILARGRFFAIEVKSPTGRLADSQKDAADKIVHAGGLWTVARSVDDVEAFLRTNDVTLHATVKKDAP